MVCHRRARMESNRSSEINKIRGHISFQETNEGSFIYTSKILLISKLLVDSNLSNSTYWWIAVLAHLISLESLLHELESNILIWSTRDLECFKWVWPQGWLMWPSCMKPWFVTTRTPKPFCLNEQNPLKLFFKKNCSNYTRNGKWIMHDSKYPKLKHFR